MSSDLHLFDIVLSEIAGVLAGLDRSSLGAAVDLLDGAPRIFVAGEGRSGYMARAFAMRLVHLGRTAFFVGDTCTPSTGRGDLLVAVSGSGTTSAVVRAARAVTEGGGAVLAVTTAPTAPLASGARHVLHVPAATKHRRAGEAATVQPLSSLFDQCAHVVLDCVCLELARRHNVTDDQARRAHANTE
ncbi:6-phospho-3-hexuloisomerase [Acrocarpospora catenulata]|uniref:6-phospho-3-hexuloisomerase n=1 Tax=Acrocarpospora catenulata TaxID=2836182 RepID=UPI001BD99DCE|nr:6-phospho-3-hexuloisomerase [Acrocarpospora catenulata]